MDLLDSVKYADFDVDEDLANAYRTVFNDTEHTRMVLNDMMNHCLWGQHSNDPDVQREIQSAQRVIWRIKAMFNGKPTKKEEIEDE